MVTLSQQLKLLADGFRKRYGKTETLTLADMTKLVTPPKFAKQTILNLVGQSNFGVKDYPITMTDRSGIAVRISGSCYCVYDGSGRTVSIYLKDDMGNASNRFSTTFPPYQDVGTVEFSFDIPATDDHRYTKLEINTDSLGLIGDISAIATPLGGVVKAILNAFTVRKAVMA